MDFKRRRLVTPTRYNRLPVPASDTDLSRVNELGYVRLVLSELSQFSASSSGFDR